MTVSLIEETAVSPNFAASDQGVVASFCAATQLQDGSLLCVYRTGAGKHTTDGKFVAQRSTDLGKSWGEPVDVFDGSERNPVWVASMPGVAQTSTGKVLASLGIVEGLGDKQYMFDPEAMELPIHTVLATSADSGSSWDDGQRLETGLARSCPTTKPFQRADGTICLPLEFLSTHGPSSTAMLFSTDDGASFGDAVATAEDTSNTLSLCDGHFAQLADGRILQVLWTFRQEGGETIDLHVSHSTDDGRSWSEPQATGVAGQVTCPVGLPDGSVLATSNHRAAPQGIRLLRSTDGGLTWPTADAIWLWDPAQEQVVNQPWPDQATTERLMDVWASLDQFSFGTPDLTRLADGTFLMTFWCQVDGITHIRALRFDVEA